MTGWDPSNPPPVHFTPRDALTFACGLSLVVVFLVLWCASGPAVAM